VSRALLVLALALLQTTAAAPRFESNRAWEHLRQIVAIGPRPAGSPAIEQTRRYIRQQLTPVAGSSRARLTEHRWTDTTPAGPVEMVNLMLTIPGESRDRIVIAGHYDTKRYREFRFVGANDGGSSAAFLIELARVLSQRRNRLTVEVLFLDGEEAVGEWAGTDHTYGSRRYVTNARATGTLESLKAMILVDMIGDRDLRLRRELNSTPWLTDIIWSAARSAGHEEHFSNEGIEIEDDHLPFLEAGVPAVDLIDFEYEAWHTPMDTLDRVSAGSLQVVGDVLLAALPQIEQRSLR
jgi:Zn-dependent M28 family amino/carboxypeptidase